MPHLSKLEGFWNFAYVIFAWNYQNRASVTQIGFSFSSLSWSPLSLSPLSYTLTLLIYGSLFRQPLSFSISPISLFAVSLSHFTAFDFPSNISMTSNNLYNIMMVDEKWRKENRKEEKEGKKKIKDSFVILAYGDVRKRTKFLNKWDVKCLVNLYII